MKKAVLLLASLFFAPLAISAQAADSGMSDMGMGKMDKSGMGMEKMSGHHMMMGMHKMSGTVDKVDHATGMLSLKTGAGDLMLHFPPPAVKDLKDGDAITVQLSFSKDSGMKK
jgi:hypothetical protein